MAYCIVTHNGRLSKMLDFTCSDKVNQDRLL